MKEEHKELLIKEKILNWFISGGSGMSSEAMVSAALDIPNKGKNYPLDPADFNRCLKLLDAVPELRKRKYMKRIANMSPTWAEFIEHWNELESTFTDEVGHLWEHREKMAEKTYNMISSLIDKHNKRNRL